MSVLSDEEREKGLVPSPIDAVIERVKALAAENAQLRTLLASVRDGEYRTEAEWHELRTRMDALLNRKPPE